MSASRAAVAHRQWHHATNFIKAVTGQDRFIAERERIQDGIREYLTRLPMRFEVTGHRPRHLTDAEAVELTLTVAAPEARGVVGFDHSMNTPLIVTPAWLHHLARQLSPRVDRLCRAMGRPNSNKIERAWMCLALVMRYASNGELESRLLAVSQALGTVESNDT